MTAWRDMSEEQRERKRAWSRQYYAKRMADPEKRKAIAAKASAAYHRKKAENPEWAAWAAIRARRVRRRRAGIVDAHGETRHGECPVCLNARKLSLDHDHGSGLVRGWLCRACNAALGVLGDDLIAAERLVEYLKRAQLAQASPLSDPSG